MSARRAAPRGARPKRHRLLWALVLLIVLTPLVAVGILWSAISSPLGDSPDVIQVQVPRGANGQDVVEALAAKGLAEHPRLTYWAIRLDGGFDDLKPGIYEVPGTSSTLDVSDILKRPAAISRLSLMIVPGDSVWDVARRIEQVGLGKADQVLKLATDPEFVVSKLQMPVFDPGFVRSDGVPVAWLEGYLFPETYFFDVDADAAEALRRVTEHFSKVWTELKTRHKADLMAIQERYQLSEHELLVLASLVEKEVRVASEAQRVAGVFYNRLAKGMPLQTDPTLMYHPERLGQAPRPDNRRDASNPYNTYAIAGLPPGPICNPGRGALEAVLRPERHDFLYFVAMRDGTGAHVFARTLDEHNANVRRYLRGEGAGGP